MLTIFLGVGALAQPVRLEKGQLHLHGDPFLILGGELANSSASSADYMDASGTWQTLREAGLNTVLAPVYWELLEPEEGRFDFSTVDYLLSSARSQDLHLVLLWFGTWKNSMSCYVPAWVKRGFGKRFTLAENSDGTVPEIISAFDGEALKTDCKAFAALMRHLREVDGNTGPVLMVRVVSWGMPGSTGRRPKRRGNGRRRRTKNASRRAPTPDMPRRWPGPARKNIPSRSMSMRPSIPGGGNRENTLPRVPWTT